MSRQQTTSQKENSQAILPKSDPFQTRPFAAESHIESFSEAQSPGHNLANIDLTSPVQAKLTIGQPGDKYEQEADQVAAQVVKLIHAPTQESVQRQPLSEALDKIQMHPLLQRRSTPSEEDASTKLESSISQARGNGQSMSDSIRQPMEKAFGTDFSDVKIHTDAKADMLSRSINALAFTTQNDIFFKQGAYNPGSSQGQELLAHELTHTIQQTGSKPLQLKPDSRSPSSQISRSTSPNVQRVYLDNPKLFSEKTQLGAFYSRGLHAEMDRLLMQYEQLYLAELQNTSIAGNLAHIDKKLGILLDLEKVTEAWVYNHFDKKDAAKAKQTRVTPTLDLQEEVRSAIDKLLQARSKFKQGGTRESVRDELRDAAMENCLKSRVAPLVDLAIPNPGNKASLEVELKIDAFSPGYVGFKLGLELERPKEQEIKVRAELAATGGVEVPKVLDIQAQIGGYLEAQAQGSTQVMNLVSYGLYRRLLESKLFPTAAVNMIWGGSTNRQLAELKAQQWEEEVERGVFGKEGGEDAYVDLGFLAGAELGLGDEETVGAKGGIKYTTGMKYSSESITKGAGGLGKTGGKVKKGEGVSSFGGKVKVNAGSVEGELKLKSSWKDAEINQPENHKDEVEASLKIGDLGDGAKMMLGVASGLANLARMVSSDKQNKKQKASNTASSLDNLSGAFNQLAGKKEIGNLKLEKGGTAARGVLTFEKDGKDPWKGDFSLESVSELKLNAADKLKVTAERAERVFRIGYDGGWFFESSK